jgi:uncharacterized membrane protein
MLGYPVNIQWLLVLALVLLLQLPLPVQAAHHVNALFAALLVALLAQQQALHLAMQQTKQLLLLIAPNFQQQRNIKI